MLCRCGWIWFNTNQGEVYSFFKALLSRSSPFSRPSQMMRPTWLKKQLQHCQHVPTFPDHWRNGELTNQLTLDSRHLAPCPCLGPAEPRPGAEPIRHEENALQTLSNTTAIYFNIGSNSFISPNCVFFNALIEVLPRHASSRICGCCSARGVYRSWSSLMFLKKTVVEVTGS